MAFTYVPANCAPTNADYLSAIRFLIQDTDSATGEILDEEITALYALTNTNDSLTVRAYVTSIAVGLALHRRYAKQATFTSGKTSVQHTERAKYWAVTIDDFRRELQAARMADGQIDQGGIIYAGRPTSFRDQMGSDEGSGTGGTLGGYIQ